MRRNAVRGRPADTRLRDLDNDGTLDLVVANIISSVLLELLPVMHRSLAPDGRAILSGILTAEREQMLATLTAGGWSILAEDREEIWWSVAVTRI